MITSLPPFERAKVLVVGDIILDRYWHGEVLRISPEAPVPVVNIASAEDRLGGAGNVALNLKTLGCTTTLLGLVGNDSFASLLEQMLAQNDILSYLLRVEESVTINKLRVISHNQHLMRVDFERPFHRWAEEEFFEKYLDALRETQVVILSDYNKGTLRNSRRLIDAARELNKLVLVDPKKRDFHDYAGAHIITPNLSEFEIVVGPCKDEQEIELKARELIGKHNFESVLVTRGAKGMSLISREHAMHLPTEAKSVYDVTGAGDTVIATLGAALAAGSHVEDAVVLANIAAGEVVSKLGTSTISQAELTHALQRRNDAGSCVLSQDELLRRVALAKAQGKRVVMTNGCFDLLHVGHIQYLEKAKALGDYLIVAVNDDQSVVRLKGPTRPINLLKDRLLMLGALSCIDWITAFTEDTPERLIKLVNPDVLVKGGDYQIAGIAGADHVLSQGGKVTTLPFEEGFSTTALIEKVHKLTR